VYVWGQNFNGQLGNGTNIDSNVPIGPVDGLLIGKTIIAISAGADFVIALSA
jgi:alpha-tubulin suppressor-like RCC1 family protein